MCRNIKEIFLLVRHGLDAFTMERTQILRLAEVKAVSILPAFRRQVRKHDAKPGDDCAGQRSELQGGDHAACFGESVARSSGKGVPACFAARRRCAILEAGMPIVFQLWTVDTGASINLATAEVPPR
nr:MAG TPA_asm: hypothetical protein [Caudoviricetes sp.]